MTGKTIVPLAKIFLTSITKPNTEFLGDFFFLCIRKCIVLCQSFATDKATHRVVMSFSMIACQANQTIGFFDWVEGFCHKLHLSYRLNPQQMQCISQDLLDTGDESDTNVLECGIFHDDMCLLIVTVKQLC